MWYRNMKSDMCFTRNSNRTCSIVKSEKSLPTPILVIILLLLINSQAYSAKESFLKELNLNTLTHRYTAMVIDSKNNIYVSSEQNLYKSTNGGAEWREVLFDKQDIFSNIISDLALDKEDNLYIDSYYCLYFLKADADTAHSCLGFDPSGVFVTNDDKVWVKNGNSILVSTDNSKTWKDIFATKEEMHNLLLMNTKYVKDLGFVNVMNYGYDSTAIYHTTDFGKIWYKLDCIPGTNYQLKEFDVIDENIWLVELYNENKLQVYNFEDKILHEFKRNDDIRLGIQPYKFGEQIYLKYDGEIYEYTYNTPPKKIISNIPAFGSLKDYVTGFAIDNNGVMFAAKSRGKLQKSTDYGNTWQIIDIDMPIANLAPTKFKYTNGSLLTMDRMNYLYHSSDEGNNWTRIKIPFDSTYKSDFDFNTNKEIIVAIEKKLIYTNDFGLNWKVLDTNLTKYYSNFKVCLQDDGSVFASLLDYGALYFKSPKDTAVFISGTFKNITKLADGRIFTIYNKQPAVSNSDFTQFYTLKGFPEVYEYLISKAGKIYCASAYGIYKANDINSKGDLTGFKDLPVSSLSEDENGYIYLLLETTNSIYRSKDEGNTWQNISSKLPLLHIYSVFAFGNQKIIEKTDKLYIGQLTDDKILQTKITYQSNKLFFKDSTRIDISISDNYDVPQEGAKSIIFYALDNTFDTVMTDESGNAEYFLKSNYYTPGALYQFPIYIWAESETAYASPIYMNDKLYGQSIIPNQRVFHLQDPYYYFCLKGKKPVYNFDMFNVSNQKISGKFLIENSLTGTKDMVNYDAINPIDYQFDIPNNAEYGMYSIIFKGVNEQGDTARFETYIIITDTIFEFPDTAAIDPPKYAVYPNPVKDFVTISNFWGKAQIFDIFGREIWSGMVEEKITINTASFSQGLYILKTVNSQINQTIVTKIMKE